MDPQHSPPSSGQHDWSTGGSCSPTSAIVAIAFSTKHVTYGTWQSLTALVVHSIQQQLHLSPSCLARQRRGFRLLDPGENDGLARVCEISIDLSSPEPRPGPLGHDGDGSPSTASGERLLTLEDCRILNNTPAMQSLQREASLQLVLQPGWLYALHAEPGLAVFDMDSTLIQQEVIDELARAVGRYDHVSAITEAAMRGEPPYTDFSASLRARVACLRGVPVSIWDQLKAGTITFTPGAADLVRVLRHLGWKTAVLSGGFTPLALWVKDTLGLDHAYANHLVVDDQRGILTGELQSDRPIVHAERKRELLLELARHHHLPLERCVAIGDGSNDLLMMHAAGFGIAFNAKPKVQLAAPAKINTASLLDVLFLLSHDHRFIRRALAVED